MIQIGITERGDAALDTSWKQWVMEGHQAILITKNARKLFEGLYEDKKLNLINPKNIIVHATVTGYAGTDLEPNVPKPDWRSINNAKEILGLADLVLRVDPIIPTEEGTKIACDVIDNFNNNKLNSRVRISFIDNYYHIRDRGVKLPWTSLHAPLEMRKESYNKILKVCTKYDYSLEVCGEPSFECKGCISKRDLQSFNIDYKNIGFPKNYQRGACACLGIKHELLNNKHPCAHKCKYCYWKD